MANQGTAPQEPASYENILEQMFVRINQLEEALNQAKNSAPTPSNSQSALNETPQPTMVAPAAARPTYPDTETFSGENRKEYEAFRLNLRTKLEMDSAYFSTPKKRVMYAYGRLRGKAAQIMMAWVNAKERKGAPYDLDEFYKELDRAFNDPDQRQRALVRIHQMRQGKRELREFLGEFNQVLAEAGALDWTDEQKKGFLESAVSGEILSALIGHPALGGDDSYEKYCETLMRVDHQQRRLQNFNRAKQRAQAYAITPTTTKQKDPDAMDWERTTTEVAALRSEIAALRTNQTQAQRARWVTESELQDRRTKGACFRCGKTGHLVGKCNLLPARRPSTAKVASIKPEANEPNDDHEEDSGNE
jgi:hypothetical protein